jgi:DNA-binding NtrC family response regulator
MTALSTIVLVVEDEGLIRMRLVDELEDAGFIVFEAGSADEALNMLRAHPEIEAVFSDIDMPGSMDGLKLAKLVRHSRPELAILLTSGYLKIPKNDIPGKLPFLSKPYEIDAVVNHIRELTIHQNRKDCAAVVFTT